MKQFLLFLFVIVTTLLYNQTPLLAQTVSISGSSGGTSVAQTSPVYIASNVNVTGTTFNGAIVSISANFASGQDALGIDGITSGTSGGISYSYNATKGILTLTGVAVVATYQTVLRKVTYTNTSAIPSTSTRSITISLNTALPYSGNGHYYEFKTSSGITWADAKTAAEGLNYFGLKGYLATITSAEENTFCTSKLSGEGWIGASDAAAEGTWRWVTGPEGLEDSGKGRNFYTGQSPTGAAVGSNYVNWHSGEPSNSDNGSSYKSRDEDYAHFRTDGTWNDFPGPDDVVSSINGYVVEYGGLSGDAIADISDVVSVNVSVPVTIAATGIQSYSFNANWNTVSGATNYYLDVATNSSFTALVSGYNNKDVGNVTTYNVTGLNPVTQYYYRVRSTSQATGFNSNTISATTIKADQTITFDALPVKTYGDSDFSPGATASSGLTVSYTTSDPNVATIAGGLIHIVGAGTCTIYADQSGNSFYNTAPQVNRLLSVNAISVIATSGTLGPTWYTSLQTAFAAINVGTHQGEITLKIYATTTETATAVLYQSGYNATSSYTSINIYPTATGLSIRGNLDAPLIDLNGADNVTIDGRVNATGAANNLTITNTSTSTTAGTSTIRFINDASSNTVKYCTIKGSTTDATAGILFFSTTTGTTGNDNNTINNNNITNSADANRPVNAIYSLGTASMENSGNTISNNNIYDFLNPGLTSRGIYIYSNSTAWTISGNSFYETASFVPTADVNYQIINIANASGINFTVSNNYIGGSAASCGGTAWTKTAANNNIFYGIYLTVGTATPSNVQGNTISGFYFSNSNGPEWYGIYIFGGAVNIGTSTGNIIGSSTGTGSITLINSESRGSLIGIANKSSGIVNIQNNTIGSITTSNASTHETNLIGIYSEAGTTTISNNTIGSTTTANSIQASSTSTASDQYVFGIYSARAVTISGNTISKLTNGTTNVDAGTPGAINGIVVSGGTNTISGNTISDLTIANANSSSDNNASVVGINQTSTAVGQSISGNTIYNLSNTNSSFAGSVIGMYYNGPTIGTNSVYKNFIYNLSVNAGSSTANIYGIKIDGGASTYSNNIVSLGGNTKTMLAGIYESGINNSLYFNTVYIGGTLPDGSININSHALWSVPSNITNTLNVKNNIFSNARTNVGSSTGCSNIALDIASSSNLTCDYNDYYAPGTGGYIGFYISGWGVSMPIVTGQDSHSLNIDPYFASAGGTSAANYLPANTYLVAATGTGIATDYAGTTRATLPKMGAYEFVSTPTNITGTGTWSTITQWDNGTPIPSSDITVGAGIVTVDGNYTVNNATVNSDGALSIGSGKSLTINGNLTLKSDATNTTSLIIDGGTLTVNGTVTVERYMLQNKWYIISPAASGGTVADFLTLNTNIPTSGSNRGMRDYNTSSNIWNPYYTSGSGNMEAGKGYAARISTTGVVKFVGALTYGDKSVTVTRSGDNGWNCIGNPYTSAINIDETAHSSNNFLTVNVGNLDPSYAAMYVWNESGANDGIQNYYNVVNNSGFTSSHASLGQHHVQIGQGFIVKVKPAATSVKFTPAMQIHKNDLLLKSTRVRWPSVELTVKTDSLSAYTAIAYNDQMTLGLDPSYDAGLLRGANKLNIYSHLITDNGIDFAVQCLPDKQMENQVIPIGIDYQKGGQVKISAQITELPSGTNVVLEDRLNKTFSTLNSGNEFNVTVDPNTKGIGRFYLHTTALSENDLKTTTLTGKLNAYVSSNNEIRIIGEVSSKAIATLYDTQGKAILSQNLKESNLNVIPTSNIKTGIYMLSVRDTGKLQSFKLFIKQ